jgi:hypothetical protein
MIRNNFINLMNNAILLFKEDSKEITQAIKNKINLLRSPVNLLNETEVQEINNFMKKYKEKIEKLSSTFNNPENISNNSTDLDVYNQIMNQFKDTTQIIEKIIQEYKNSLNTRTYTDNNVFDKDDTISETSEYFNKDRVVITRVFLNSIVTTQQITELRSKKTQNEEIAYICEIYNLKQDSNKEYIVIDFYRDIYKFCLIHKFSIEKISTFMSIMYFIFNYSILNKKVTKDKSISVFNDVINYHSIQRPPYNYEIFSNSDKTAILEYTRKGFYRNFILYENIFKYNMNINIYSKEMIKIPTEGFPLLNHLDMGKTVDSDTLEILKDVFNKEDIYKPNILVQEVVTNIDEAKNEFEKYKEEELEHMRKVIHTLSKSKAEWDSARVMADKLKEDKFLEYETNEVKNFIDVKINEIGKETEEAFDLADNNIINQANNFLARLQTPAKKN